MRSRLEKWMAHKDALAGKTAIVSGAAQGIGATYARALAEAGAAVVVCDILDPQQTVESILRAGFTAMGCIVDVTDGVQVSGLVDAAIAAYGQVDILVNNAAIFGGLPRTRFTEITPADWDRVLITNTRSVFIPACAVAPHMSERRQGKIINIASTTVHSGTPFLLHYVASKGAVVAMTRSLARELGDFGISVNCIAPGLTMSEAAKTGSTAATSERSIQARSFKREQKPEDLIGPLLFLAADDSGFMTGQTLVVDGGAIMS
jgi:NAD(P)-dependent dehydrogenase (short-subunit alcohol dehydrogenase family)